MSKFASTNRSNDCPVCGDISGDCRTKDDGGKSFVLCRTNGDAKLFDLVDGWKCVKPGSRGWATFTPDAAQPQISYQERQQRRAQRDAEEKAIYQAGLSPDERHAAHTQLLAQLPLHDDDRADLKRRGLSDEAIESGQFRSIEPGQTLDLPISPKTPGVGFGGKKLLTRTAGYLVPARDTEGRILGFQIRNRTGDKPKYPWLSVAGVIPANLQNGEMPITVARGGNGPTLYFAEGLLKPMVAAEKLGINVIGASGGNFASSPEQLAQCISALLPETLVLCPDAGSVANVNVVRSYAALNDELFSQGRELKVLWWEQRTKASGDIDEISQEQFEQAELISWAEFSQLAPTTKEKPKIATAAPASPSKHWDYERPMTGVWGQIADTFNDSLSFKSDAPALADLLPEKMAAAMAKGKPVSSPQAIALKAYAAFLQKATDHDYQAEAQALISGVWDWAGIPTREPLWGWKGFLMAVGKHCDKAGKAALKECRTGLKQEAADEKAAQTKALADRWEMIPSGAAWLDTRFFGSAITDEIKAAGDERLSLGVYGATGTGKSFALGQLREYAESVNRQFVYLTVKETLARAQGKDLGLTYRLDLQIDGEAKQQFPDMAGCGASLIENARGIDWRTQIASNAIVVIDEADLFLSMAGGAGASHNALELQRVLSQVLGAAQTSLLMSAQLKSRHMKLAERIGWFDDSKLIGIKSAAVSKPITIYDDTAKPEELAEGDDREEMTTVSLKNMLIEKMADGQKAGENALLMTAAQKPDSKTGTMLLEQFALQECGTTSVIRLDSQSTKDPNHPAFKIAEQDYVSLFRQAQLAICSPSAQEGFNLKFGELDGPSHFANVYVLDSGSKLPEQLIQDIGRDRHATPTHVLVSAGHNKKQFGGTVEPREVRRQLKAISNQAETKLLGVANSNGPLNWDNAFLAFYCEDVAQVNAALADKVYNLDRYLREVGHTVEVLTQADGYPCEGIPEDFYGRIAKDHYHQPVAAAELISRFEAEELQKKGEVTLEQWYQLQNLQFRNAMRWDVHQTVDPETGEISQTENPHDNGVELDADFIRQWSRDRVAKPWQMHFYAKQSEWDWFAYDFKKTRFNSRFENQDAQGNAAEDFTPGDMLSLKSRRLSILKELGLIDFLNQWAVDVAGDEITAATSAKALAKAIHEQHPESRFTKSALDPIVANLQENFETTCELLGVQSRRNDDGGINHRQALTLLRNVFQIKTFTVSDRVLNGERGIYVLVADDKAQAFRKELTKADKLQGDEQAARIESAKALHASTHNRVEMDSVWGEHLAVERAQFLKFLKEKSYKTNLLDQQRPEHWGSLADYIGQPEPVAQPTGEPEQEDIATTTPPAAVEASTEPKPLDEDEKLLMVRLNWCQSLDEYAEIRANLESLYNDFDGRYWALLPEESKKRIFSMAKVDA